jgi:hypothetical protein
MKKVIIAIILIGLYATFASAQTINNQTLSKTNAGSVPDSNISTSDIKMKSEYGSDNSDLLSVLRFEDIGLSKMIFTGSNLNGKDFQISIKEFTNGKLAKEEVVFDSKESEYFKIKGDKFTFKVLTKITTQQTAKFDFQFNGFSTMKEYRVGENFKGFAQKDFIGSQKEIAIPLNANIYILTYLMPFVRKDGSTSYCEVAQSGINPEDFGAKYAIPTYFLIDIKFQ